jgi:hypothetical protein
MKLVFTLKDLVKYVIFIFIVYTILKMVPSQKLVTADVFLIICIVFGTFVLIDYLYKNTYFLNIINSLEDFKIIRRETKINVPLEKNSNMEIFKTEQKEPSETEQFETEQFETEQFETEQFETEQFETESSETESSETKPPEQDQSEQDQSEQEPFEQEPTKSEPSETELEPHEIDNSGSSEIETKDNSKINKSDFVDPSRPTLTVHTINEVKKQLDDLKDKLNNLQTPVPSSPEAEINSLINELQQTNVLDENEISNIYSKMQTRVLSKDNVLTNLRKLKEATSKRLTGKENPNDFSYYNPNLPPDFYKPLGNKELSLWANNYTILNTDKWKVPMPKPPVCINNTPCKVCPGDDGSTAVDYPATLKDWDVARKVTNVDLNKDWMYQKNR